MKYQPLYYFLLLFWSTTLMAQDAVMSFENLTTNLNCTTVTCHYTDPGNQFAVHLLENANGVPVSSASMGSTIGFTSIFTPTRTGGSSVGLTDGDVFGYAGPVVTSDRLGTTATDGSQVFFMQDTDGQVRLEFENIAVGVSSLFSMDYFIDATSYENTDGANDRFFAQLEISNCSTPATITLLDTDGGGPGGGGNDDLNSLNIEGSWNTLSANLTAYPGCTARLVIEADFNSVSEEMAIDNIRFTNATVLPVEWLSFEVKASERGAELRWETATETDNRGFSVERSADGRSFESIGWVDGRGDSNENNHYSFEDEQPLAGNNFYRLQQQDFDGAMDYSEVRLLDFKVATATIISIAPNPFSDEITLLRSSGLATSQVQLLDLNGRLLAAKTLQEGQTLLSLATGHLPSGVYLLRLGDEMRRVVKQ